MTNTHVVKWNSNLQKERWEEFMSETSNWPTPKVLHGDYTSHKANILGTISPSLLSQSCAHIRIIRPCTYGSSKTRSNSIIPNTAEEWFGQPSTQGRKAFCSNSNYNKQIFHVIKKEVRSIAGVKLLIRAA